MERVRDWDQADSIPRYPGGDPFPPNRRALVSEDDPELVRQRETDPDRFDSEYEPPVSVCVAGLGLAGRMVPVLLARCDS
jgi:hypothetical protein